MLSSTLLSFSFTWFLLSLSPGPAVLSTVASSIGTNPRSVGLLHICGQQIGLLIHFLVVALGAHVFIVTIPGGSVILKWIGCGYLLLYGVQLLLLPESGIKKSNGYGLFSPLLDGFLVKLTNPKSFLCITAIVPQLIDDAAPLIEQYAVIISVGVLLNALAMLVYFVFARYVTLSRTVSTRFLNVTIGLLLICWAIIFSL